MIALAGLSCAGPVQLTFVINEICAGASLNCALGSEELKAGTGNLTD